MCHIFCVVRSGFEHTIARVAVTSEMLIVDAC